METKAKGKLRYTMWKLMLYELKKMFYSPIQKILLVLLILFPLLYATFYTKDISPKLQSYFTSIKGEVDQEWYDNIASKLELNEYGELVHSDDEDSKCLFLLLNTKQMILDQEWNQISDPNYTFMQKEMNSTTFTFDNYNAWNTLRNCINMFSMIYIIYIVFMITPLFSHEYQEQTSDILKASTLGKYKVGLSKVLCSFLLIISLPIIAYTIYFIWISITKGLSEYPISLAFLQHMTPFTFQEEFQYGLGMLIVGGLGCGCFSMFISNIFKNNYISITIGFCLLFLPLFFQTEFFGISIMHLSPMISSMPTQLFETGPFILIGDHMMYFYQFAYYLWIPISIICTIASIIKSRAREA